MHAAISKGAYAGCSLQCVNSVAASRPLRGAKMVAPICIVLHVPRKVYYSSFGNHSSNSFITWAFWFVWLDLHWQRLRFVQLFVGSSALGQSKLFTLRRLPTFWALESFANRPSPTFPIDSGLTSYRPWLTLTTFLAELLAAAWHRRQFQETGSYADFTSQFKYLS